MKTILLMLWKRNNVNARCMAMRNWSHRQSRNVCAAMEEEVVVDTVVVVVVVDTELPGCFIHLLHFEDSSYNSWQAFLRGRQQWRSRRWWRPWRRWWWWTWWWWRVLVFLPWKARHVMPKKETHRGGVANIGGGKVGGGGEGGRAEEGGEQVVLDPDSSKHLIHLLDTGDLLKSPRGEKGLNQTVWRIDVWTCNIYSDHIYHLFNLAKNTTLHLALTCLTKVLLCCLALQLWENNKQKWFLWMLLVTILL